MRGYGGFAAKVLVADKEESLDGASVEISLGAWRSSIETRSSVRERSQRDCWVFLIVRETTHRTVWQRP